MRADVIVVSQSLLGQQIVINFLFISQTIVDTGGYSGIASRMLSSKVLPTSVKGVNTVSSRSICHKSKLKPKRNNYHWPYERRSWGWLNCLWDIDTKGKFDENTKVIQVEGNLASGKNDFAKKLADELGMKYYPQPDLNDYYINRHGFDYMALNALLPERLRFCDWRMFHELPTRHSVIHMQHFLYRLRLWQYCNALSHLLNTGQGVVLTRTCFTERAIVDAMHSLGWLPKGYMRGDGVRFYDWIHRYIYIRNATLNPTPKPHLTIYLDTPVDTCLKRLQEDPDPMIANSKAHTEEFLEEIETAFKDTVLPKQDHHSHVMMIDHPRHKTVDEVRDVIDDIESLDFEFDSHDMKFFTWDTRRFRGWYSYSRQKYTTSRFAREANNIMDLPYFDIAGLGDSVSYGDLCLRNALYEGHVGPVGYLQSWTTDMKVHGFLKGLIGVYENHGARINRHLKADCL